jgi:regulator of protease activity HflC (stomatin/prohibitin superfamily)
VAQPEKSDDPVDSSADVETEPLTWRERISSWLGRVQFGSYALVVVFLLALGFLWPRMFIVTPAGHRAVMYRLFNGGTVTDRIWDEGLHVIPPWDHLTDYETRLQQRELQFEVLSEEGLKLGIRASVRFRPLKDMLGHLHQDVGQEYFDRLIKPEVQSHVRRALGSRPAHEVYTSARDVQQEVGQIPLLGRFEEAEPDAPTRTYVEIEELKVLDLTLPDIVQLAIGDKYRQEQLMLEYRYRLERAEKEAERMRSEAAGIRDYNLIAGKITPDILRWRGIDATLELAKSPNSKVVVLGGGQGGLSMEMKVDDSVPATDKSAASPSGTVHPGASATTRPLPAPTVTPTASPSAP